jgi:hypothetical protein
VLALRLLPPPPLCPRFLYPPSKAFYSRQPALEWYNAASGAWDSSNENAPLQVRSGAVACCPAVGGAQGWPRAAACAREGSVTGWCVLCGAGMWCVWVHVRPPSVPVDAQQDVKSARVPVSPPNLIPYPPRRVCVRACAPVLQCMQYEGDVIFVPRDWGHGVLNTQSTIGVRVVTGPCSREVAVHSRLQLHARWGKACGRRPWHHHLCYFWPLCLCALRRCVAGGGGVQLVCDAVLGAQGVGGGGVLTKSSC